MELLKNMGEKKRIRKIYLKNTIIKISKILK